MKISRNRMAIRASLMLIARCGLCLVAPVVFGGCLGNAARFCGLIDTPASAPLGTASDQVWMNQEELGEAADFVIPTHEFKLHSHRLNNDGEDHVKRLASRLSESEAIMPVVIERSMNGKQSGQFKYPVSADPELDNQRRDLVVQALNRLGVANADEIVTVAPAFATPAFGQEAETAYYRTFGNAFSGSAFGGGFGGFGGGGVFGGSFGSGFGGGAGGFSGDAPTAPADSLSADP